MAFISHEWKDRQSTYPKRRTLTNVNSGTSITVDVERDEGSEYTENGIQYNAETMNDLEARVVEAFDRVQTELAKRLDTVYPIGSIYISKNNTSPSIVLGGGTWQSITGGVLLPSNSSLRQTGADQISKNIDFDTVFLATVNGAYAELPNHNHSISAPTVNAFKLGGSYYSQYDYNFNKTYTTGQTPYSSQQTHTHQFNDGKINVKGSISFDNRMPSTIVYAWRRVA